MTNEKDLSSKVVKELYYPKMKNHIDNNGRGREYIAYIREYIDANGDKLHNADFKYLYWRNEGKEGEVLYRTIGIEPPELRKMIKETNVIKDSWKQYNKTEYWAMICMIKYYQDLGDEQNMKAAIIYFGLALYSSNILSKFKYPPNPNIMKYTINNLSNRYDIKKLGTIFLVIQKLVFGCHETYKDYLRDSDFCDMHIKDYMNNMFVRIANFVKQILTEYNKNVKSKNYMNTESEKTSEEDFYETNNISGKIYQMTEKCANTIITSTLNVEIVENSAKMAGVSVSEVRHVVSEIIRKDDQRIKEFIALFLHQYLVVDKHPESTFNSSNFLVYVNKIYGKSNTNDKGVIRMKEILDEWLRENSEKYLKTQRVATLIAFRKSIMLFFCIATQHVILNKY
jgi:hypothetical protein